MEKFDLSIDLFDEKNQPINDFKLHFPARSENEGFARQVVSAFLLILDPMISDLEDVKTAVSEAVTNAIVHGYDGENGEIVMDAQLFREGIRICVQDFGKGIADIDQARKPMFTTANSDERSGLGFTVMETFMDSVYIYSKVNVGTKVVMFKEIKDPENLLNEDEDE